MQPSAPEPIREPHIQRLLENFSVDPTDLPTFRMLEEHLFLAGSWSRLAGVYECRIAALSEEDPEWADLMLRLGHVVAERLGDLSAARRRYEELLQSHPGHREGLATLRRLCMEMGDLGAALQIAESEEQLELPPRESAATLAEVGDLWRRLGDLAGARKRLDEARRLDPGCDAALAGCAALAEDERRIDDAIRLHEQRIDGLTGAARTDVMEHLASLLPDRERDRIRTLLREIVRASPKRRGALERLIEIEQSLGAWERVDELQRALWKVLEDDERAQLARKAATLQLEEARNIEAALFWAARADEVAGDDPAVLRLCAQIYRRAGQTAGLIDALERLIEQEGPTPMVSLELAALYDRQALPELAARRLQAHLANHPEDAEGLALLDRSLSRLGRHAERVDVLKRRIALGADPDDAARFCSELGDLLANSLDDKRGAEQAYRDALARAPGHGPAAERLQQLFRDAERFEELARFLEEFAAQASSGPAQAEAWCQLGALRLRTPADTEAARSAYIRATECDPESRAALEGLRQVAATTGDATSLLEACERELSLDPEVPRTLELLQEIIDASRRSRDLPRARRAAERWAELEPEPPALRALAEVGQELQDAACERDALESLASLLTSCPEERARVFARLGDLALEQADPESLTIASHHYRESVQCDPNPQVRERLIDLYRRTGQLSELTFELRALVSTSELEPSIPLRIELARTLAELGDCAGATSALEPAFELDPSNLELGDLLESVLSEQGRVDELCEVLGLRLAREREPSRRRQLAYRHASVLIDSLARPADALTILQEFADPRCGEGLEKLFARALEMAGSVSEHEAWLAMRESHVDGDERLNLLLRLAALQEQDGRAEQALATLQHAERLAAPEQRELVRRPLLALLRELGEPETQLAFLQKLLEDEEDPAARAAFRGERGRIWAEALDQPEKALEELEAAQAEAPLGVSELRLLSSLYRLFGAPTRQASALEALADASLRPEETSQALRELAGLRLDGPEEVRDRAEAERVLRRLVELQPDDEDAFDCHLTLLWESGRKLELSAFLEERLQTPWLTSERRGALAMRLARVQSELGKLSEAAQTLCQARAEGPESPALDELLLTSLEAAGDLPGRIQLCEEKARSEAGFSRERWLRRWLSALAEKGESAEKQLAVVQRLLEDKPGDVELMALGLPLLRRLGRVEPLAAALEAVLAPGVNLSEGRRRFYTQELLRLYEGPLGKPEAALALFERELEQDPSLRPHAIRLAARVGDPERLVKLLSPLVLEAPEDAPASPEWVRQLGLALWQTGEKEQAEPLLWRALEANPLDREVIQALEERLRQREDVPGLLRFLETHFSLESAALRSNLASEGFALAERAEEPVVALRWLRRWQALEPLPRGALRRWITLEREVGDGPGVLLALRTLRGQSEDPSERARLLAEEARLHAERGELDLAREQYEEAIRLAACPEVEWFESLDRVLAATGRNAERINVLRALLQRQDLAPDRRALHQKACIALLASQPELRGEATLELRMLIDTDPAASPNVQIKRMRTLLALHEELTQVAEWCAVASRLLPLLSGSEHAALERELARRLTYSLHARERAIARWEGILTHTPDDAEALSALGDLLRVSGHEAKRAEILERHADTDPIQRVRSLLEAARLRWESLRDAHGAFDDLERVLVDASDLEPAHELRSEVCAYLGRPAEEAASLRALLSLDPESLHTPQRWLRLGQALITQTDDSEEAIAAVEKAIALAPRDAALQREARRVFESGGIWPRAVELLREELEGTDPTERAPLLRQLARIEWDELGDAPAACESLEALAQLDLPDAEDHLRWSDALAQQERWAEAIRQRQHALEALGEMASAGVWLDLAEWILERTEEVEQACAACDHALERDPELTQALELRAGLQARLGNVAQELEDRVRLGELLCDGPEAAESLAQAGRLAREQLGDDAQAWRLFSAALEKDSTRVTALIGAGGIALERGEWSEAERMFDLSCSLLRESSEAEQLAQVAELAAQAALKQEHDAEAFRYLELALEQDPHHAGALDAMAELSLRRGAYAQARRHLESRLAQSDLRPTERAERLAGLARACEQSGELERAASALVEVAELLPNDDEVRARALDLLEQLGAADRAVTQIEAWLERVAPEQRTVLALRAARLEADAGHIAEARARLETLLEEKPGSAEAWAELAQLVFENEGSETALEVTQRGLEQLDLPPQRAPLLWIEARALLALDRTPDAAARAYEVLVADPCNIEAAQMLAANLGVSGDWQQAASQLEHTLVVTHPSAPVKAELWEAIGRAYAGPLEDIERAERCYRRALECNSLRSSAREALADITAFDPAAHPESIRQHRDLLAAFPARPGSWRALARIANHWKRNAVKQTCELVLETLAAGSDSARVTPLPAPLVDTRESAHAVVNGATEVLRALEEDGALPQPSQAPDPHPYPLDGPIQQAVQTLVSRAWELSDETLRSIWHRPVDEDEPAAGEVPRRAKRRIRRALRSTGSETLGELEPEFWREQVLAQAAAMTVQEGKSSLTDALLQLLALWPATSHLGLRSGGELGAAVQLCTPARALLLRICDAAIEGLG